MPDTLYIKDGQKSLNHKPSEDAYSNLMTDLRKKFNWINTDQNISISDPYVHELIGEPVTRCCVAAQYARELLERNVFVCHRLFDLTNQQSVIYTTDLYTGETPSGIPAEAFVFAETNHYEEFNRPCSELLETHKEYFFVAPVEVMNTLGVDTTDVNESTVYSAIHHNGGVVAFRRYTNFDDTDTTSTLANWSLLVVLAARKAKRNDVIGKLLELGY